MNPRGLRAALSVADTGSVTAAARLLSLTQSGVSRQVAALEAEIGFALFDRQRGRLRLSRRGEAFIAHLRRALDALDDLPRAARSIADGAIGRVEVAATSAIIHGVLPPVVARYVIARPGRAPVLAMRSLSEIEALGPDEHFDLVFVPAPMRPAGLMWIGQLDFELELIAPVGRFEQSTTPVPIAALDGCDFISLDPFARFQADIESSLAGAGARVNYTCETTSVIAALQLVQLGVGCTFVDPFVAETVAGSVCTRHATEPRLPGAYGIFTRPGNVIGADTRLMLELLSAHARDCGANLTLG